MAVDTLHEKFNALAPELTERSRRLWAATEALAIGRGGIALVERATGISRSTVVRGIREVRSGPTVSPGRTRKEGGGRKASRSKDHTLAQDLEAVVEPSASGHPESPLRWTSKSVRHLAGEIQSTGNEVSHRLVAQLLNEAGYSLQAKRKTGEGASHPDRDAQFRYINEQVAQQLALGQRVISVDTKKKELVGDFKSGGREGFTLYQTGVTSLAKNLVNKFVELVDTLEPAHLYTPRSLKGLAGSPHHQISVRDLKGCAGMPYASCTAKRLIHPSTTHEDVERLLAASSGLYAGMKLIGSGELLFLSEKIEQARRV